jgi:Zn-dependent protease
MLPTHSGSVRFFRFAGIQVFVHWSWFVVAVIEMSQRRGSYRSPAWNIAEYLALFLIVLLHEFGHAFACRQTGGQADQIVLWPLGGVAYVNPPQRPGATLWSIAAGPLVNVVLLPVLFGLYYLGRQQGWGGISMDMMRLISSIAWINLGLLVFNILPIYPLDGGQIVQSLLWFAVGRARSLQIAAGIGLVGSGAFLAYAIYRQSIWIGIMAFFLGQRCLISFRQSKGLFTLARMPRHTGFACPSCHEAPPGGPIWICSNCRNRFDPFSTIAVCPHCQTRQEKTQCPHCGEARQIEQWRETAGNVGGFRN